MAKGELKEAAEAVLRELPSVVGAFVREDVLGHPREVHLLIRPGPDPRHLAHDVRDLLEERLGVPVDQRVISIAQLAAADALPPERAGQASGPDAPTGAGRGGPPGGFDRPTGTGPLRSPRRRADRPADADPRPRFLSVETQVREARVLVRATLRVGGQEVQGEAIELEAAAGRARAGAAAALQALGAVPGLQGHFELENASVVRVQDREYVLVSAFASSPYLGRRPLSLAGAQPVEVDVESAAALAALKAVNRVVALMLRLTAGAR